MSKQEKFYRFAVQQEPPPRDRRIYAAAKAPFGYLWTFILWLGTPFAVASPYAIGAAVLLNVVVHFGDWQAIITYHFWLDTAWIGLAFTLCLGGFFLVLLILSALF